MCSKKCAKPCSFSASWFAPIATPTSTVAVSARSSGLRSTVMPFSSVCFSVIIGPYFFFIFGAFRFFAYSYMAYCIAQSAGVIAKMITTICRRVPTPPAICSMPPIMLVATENTIHNNTIIQNTTPRVSANDCFMTGHARSCWLSTQVKSTKKRRIANIIPGMVRNVAITKASPGDSMLLASMNPDMLRPIVTARMSRFFPISMRNPFPIFFMPNLSDSIKDVFFVNTIIFASSVTTAIIVNSMPNTMSRPTIPSDVSVGISCNSSIGCSLVLVKRLPKNSVSATAENAMKPATAIMIASTVCIASMPAMRFHVRLRIAAP